MSDKNLIGPSSVVLVSGGARGITAVKGPVALLYGFWKIRRSRIRGGAVADTFALRETEDLGVSYMGWARRAS